MAVAAEKIHCRDKKMSHYQISETGSRCDCATEMYNRVLFGSHEQDAAQERYFTFAGDVPAFLGASTDYTKDLFSFYSKNGHLFAGVALTPGRSVPYFYAPDADMSSAWFHKSRDISCEWRHGYMHYELSQVSPWFPDFLCEIDAFPLSPHDGVAVHFHLCPEGRMIFCAGFGGITDFLGRFEYHLNGRRNYCAADAEGNRVVLEGDQAVVEGPNGVRMRIATSLGMSLKTGSASELEASFPSVFLADHAAAGEGEVVKLDRVVEAGEVLDGWIIVGKNIREDEMRRYLQKTDLAETLQDVIRAKHAPYCVMKTPDAMLDSTVPDTIIAHDASFHGRTFYHGAYGYHTPFLGWRGWYAPTLLGWKERVKSAISSHLATQLQPDGHRETVWYDGAERPELDHVGTQYHHLEHTCGKLTALLHRDDIYNMNEVAVNMMLYYFEHEEDRDFAERCFEGMSKILEWEERIFRHEGTGLYQNFLNTWISDGHSYNGGGCAQASCYNLLANRLMARLARKLGCDDAPFSVRAEAIAAAIQTHLWLEKEGVLAEYVDTIGHCMVHPSPELSTIYLAIECGALSREQARRSLAWVEGHVRSIDSQDRHGRLSYSSNWLPKKYSTCGLFPGENACLALAYFDCGMGKAARHILDALVDCFFSGSNPGQTRHVVSSRCGEDLGDLDFTDVSGTYLRMVFEGLWGIKPRRLSNTLIVAPQLYPEWKEASLSLNGAEVVFRRNPDGSETWRGKFSRWADIPRKMLRIPRKRSRLLHLALNGKEIVPFADSDSEFLVVDWSGLADFRVDVQEAGKEIKEYEEKPFEKRNPLPRIQLPLARLEHIDLTSHFNVELEELHRQRYVSPRPEKYSIGVQITGRYAWEWTHGGHNSVEIDTAMLRHVPAGIWTLKSGWKFSTPAQGRNLLAVSIWDNFPTAYRVPLCGCAKGISILAIGVTNAMQNSVPNASITVEYVDGTVETRVLVHPDGFDDFMVPALQKDYENAYFSDFNHANVYPIALDERKSLAAIVFEGIANEVIFGILAVTLHH